MGSAQKRLRIALIRFLLRPFTISLQESRQSLLQNSSSRRATLWRLPANPAQSRRRAATSDADDSSDESVSVTFRQLLSSGAVDSLIEGAMLEHNGVTFSASDLSKSK